MRRGAKSPGSDLGGVVSGTGRRWSCFCVTRAALFCREALADLSRCRAAIEAEGVRLAIVHMSEPLSATMRFEEHNLGDVHRYQRSRVSTLSGLRSGTRPLPPVVRPQSLVAWRCGRPVARTRNWSSRGGWLSLARRISAGPGTRLGRASCRDGRRSARLVVAIARAVTSTLSHLTMEGSPIGHLPAALRPPVPVSGPGCQTTAWTDTARRGCT